MTILIGFLPWIIFWIALGNASLLLACVIAAVASIALVVFSARRGSRPNILDVGSVVFFVAASIVAAFVDPKVMEPWMSAVSSWVLVVIVLISVIAGRPFVRGYAERRVSAEIVNSERFKAVTMRLTLVWLGAFVVTAISTTIPPATQPGLSIRDANSTFNDVFLWAIPLIAVAIAAIMTFHTQREAAERRASAQS